MKLLVTAAATAAIAAVGVVAAPGAVAAERKTVCAESLYVREEPVGRAIGTLYAGQSMDVERYSGSGWAYGFAYGQVNAYGWVQDGWFC